MIVGAGSAGCVLASRLSEDPGTSVLLLEAGGRDRKLHVRVPAAFSKLFRSRLDWGYDTVPQAALDGRRVVFPRGKVLGGSSSINAMMAIRGHRADQDPWPRRLELGRRRGVVRAERPPFPPGEPARPEPADARLPRVGRCRRHPARGGPQRRRQRGRRAHTGLHPPRTAPQRRRRLPETGHAQAEPDGRHRRARDPAPRRGRSCPRGRVPPGWARGGGARRARGRARRRGDRHAQAPPALRDRSRRGARAARDRRRRRIARRGPEPARPPGERCARHGRRRDAPDGRAAASPALVAGPGTRPAHVERGGGRSVRPGRPRRPRPGARADLRPGAVRGGGDGPAVAGRRHRRHGAAAAAERRRGEARVRGSARRAGDRSPLPHRPGRAGRGPAPRGHPSRPPDPGDRAPGRGT